MTAQRPARDAARRQEAAKPDRLPGLDRLVGKSDWNQCRFAEGPAPELADGIRSTHPAVAEGTR